MSKLHDKAQLLCLHLHIFIDHLGMEFGGEFSEDRQTVLVVDLIETELIATVCHFRSYCSLVQRCLVTNERHENVVQLETSSLVCGKRVLRWMMFSGWLN